MQLPEMFIHLFQRFTPANAESMGNLKIELLNYYNSAKNEMMNNKAKNKQIDQQQENLTKELENLDVHTPEYEEKLFRFEKLEEQRAKPTLVEKGISFFEKPLVRVGMMVLFALLSWWITKKVTSKKEVEDLETEEPPQPQYGQPYYGYQPHPNWNPYGYQPQQQPRR